MKTAWKEAWKAVSKAVTMTCNGASRAARRLRAGPRDAVAGLSEAASDGGDGITVAANRDGIADGVLEVRRGEECNGVIRRTVLRME